MRSLYDAPARLALNNAGAQKNHHVEVMIVSFWKIPAGGRRVFKHLTTSPIKKREKSSNSSQVDYFVPPSPPEWVEHEIVLAPACVPVRITSLDESRCVPVRISSLVYVSAPLSHLPNATQLSGRESVMRPAER